MTYNDSIAEWLQSYEWHDFATLTNRRRRRDTLAFIRDIDNVVNNPWRSFSVKRMFVALEPFKFTYDLHAHCLICYSLPHIGEGFSYERAYRSEARSEFRRVFGRTDVTKIRSNPDVALYCSKYVTKYSNGDNWNLLGDWRH